MKSSQKSIRKTIFYQENGLGMNRNSQRKKYKRPRNNVKNVGNETNVGGERK